MFVKSDPEYSGSYLTKGVMVDEEDIILQLFFSHNNPVHPVYPVKKNQRYLARFFGRVRRPATDN